MSKLGISYHFDKRKKNKNKLRGKSLLELTAQLSLCYSDVD